LHRSKVVYGASVMSAVFGVGTLRDYRRATFFAAASGSLEAWRALLPVAARLHWEARGEGEMFLVRIVCLFATPIFDLHT